MFVNADLIAAGLAPFRAAGVTPLRFSDSALRSGRVMLGEIDTHARVGRSFAFETTLAGRAYLRRITAWRADGYRVKLLFLSLKTPEVAIVPRPDTTPI